MNEEDYKRGFIGAIASVYYNSGDRDMAQEELEHIGVFDYDDVIILCEGHVGSVDYEFLKDVWDEEQE
jgi:hypothetical protein